VLARSSLFPFFFNIVLFVVIPGVVAPLSVSTLYFVFARRVLVLDANLQQLVGTTETGFPTSALVVGLRRDGLVLPHVLHCHTQEQESIATTTAFPAVDVYISEYLGMQTLLESCVLFVCLDSLSWFLFIPVVR
jgi:hypothetical protein